MTDLLGERIETSAALGNRSVVLTGFMATGKSVVGRALAERLGRQFVDVDEVISERAGMSIPALFATRGEREFRAIEAAVCAELGARRSLVVATGGGALVSQENRASFADALVVCLDAAPAEILARVGDPAGRPMLVGGPPEERIATLLAARRDAYAAIPLHVDTTGRSVEGVADEVLMVARANPPLPSSPPPPGWEERVRAVPHPLPSWGRGQGDGDALLVATPEGSYPIFVGPNLLDRVGPTLADRGGLSTRCAVVTNSVVGGLYAARVLGSLESAGFRPILVEVPEGERHKTLATLGGVYDRLVDAGLDRRSAVIALGGGVVGDLAGLAAATFLRGVPFVQLPTTLLSMVDSSIGGKVAVDHSGGKNLIGAFKQPRAVLADTETLASLPADEWRSGLAEVVKHAVIADPALFRYLRERGATPATAHEWLPAAISVKREVVQRDPFESGERAHLNLGHTFGHAIEKLADFRLRHGDGVAIGLVCAANLAARLELASPSLAAEIVDLLESLDVPARVPVEHSAGDIIAAMSTDKKRVNGRLRFVVPSAIGDVTVVGDVPPADVAAAIDASR